VKSFDENMPAAEQNNNFDLLWFIGVNFMAGRHSAEVSRVFPRFPELVGGGSLGMRCKSTC